MSLYKRTDVTLAGPSILIIEEDDNISPMKDVKVTGTPSVALFTTENGVLSAESDNWNVEAVSGQKLVCNKTANAADAQDLIDSVDLVWPHTDTETNRARVDMVANTLADATASTIVASTCASGAPYVFSIPTDSDGAGSVVLTRYNRDTGDSTSGTLTGLSTTTTALNRLVAVSETTVLFMGTNTAGTLALLQGTITGGAVTVITSQNVTLNGNYAAGQKVAVFWQDDTTADFVVVDMADTSTVYSGSLSIEGLYASVSVGDNVYALFTKSEATGAFIATFTAASAQGIAEKTVDTIPVAGSGGQNSTVNNDKLFFASSTGGGFQVWSVPITGDETAWTKVYDFDSSINMSVFNIVSGPEDYTFYTMTRLPGGAQYTLRMWSQDHEGNLISAPIYEAPQDATPMRFLTTGCAPGYGVGHMGDKFVLMNGMAGHEVHMGENVPEPTPTTPQPTTPMPTKVSSSSKLAPWAIALIVIAVLLVVLAIAVPLYLRHKRNKRS